ncbi:bifunctional diaminohydroxyphosphoribosylaminopyrimidine deaminase/5-amino-6-(5-phosphoribosylamino)uracil reductase RibD [Ehrlichia ruminantium]|uniref:Riboflavin biosynthesis protein RibD n=1 Tax=Ehrlichia ruminantium TaxID=779 RepID=A0AAE6Q8L0_EHRRU|nr:bifunctional diaminohydroxyphosphoribosylaminopyrimidine deaminase/5-amino-6-(5-phosphoribosylamino)uracil reductase RibD [Ehrlichia ruminantium]QGR02200.1 bifunctional diaminohydroxyphosphoribosylaminopyrimidine deaminase/5-amino-6-(5-phosphoribosylamino)uracil reductase RibD [Ehrlichia ruminantium]QGR03122.1 bifunctional diaminohydroxyphosphoribosylaminopyrimidine deaminase/5-amino-6-(5-phosphoribosylamino)uracil reductase RibD [Ehrlichia ruminantium]QGR04047.1 bifunctional diaminohydroxyph
MKYYDKKFMSLALRLARRGLGNVFPNPAVGCIIVNNGVIVGRGWTQVGGRPHAEIVALNNAGCITKGATAYVTLEPCSHYGKTGPCVLNLINAGIKRVVIATSDPDMRVAGNGIKLLRYANVEVECGVMHDEARALNIGFFYSKIKNRPFITVKIASTLDGKIALSNGKSKWITNELTRTWVHKQRSMYDAVMVGSNTIVQDDPMLNTRIPSLESYSPIRVVVDRSGKVSNDHNIIKNADVIPTYILTNNVVKTTLGAANYLIVNAGDNFLVESMKLLVKKVGITRLFVEGGGILITELLKNNLVDQIIWCRSDKIFGSNAIPAICNLSIVELQCVYNFKRVNTLYFEGDIVDILECTENRFVSNENINKNMLAFM